MTGIHINRYLAKCLYCICMEQNLVFLCNLSNFPDRLDRSDLIICKHHRNKDRIRTNRFFQFIKLYDTVLVHIQICDLKSTLFFQILTRMQDCMVLDLCRDDMFSFLLIRFGSRFQCPVVRLGTPCRKIDFVSLCAKCLRNNLSLSAHHFLISGSKTIHTGWIAIVLCKVRNHCIHYFWCSFRCCRIV